MSKLTSESWFILPKIGYWVQYWVFDIIFNIWYHNWLLISYAIMYTIFGAWSWYRGYCIYHWSTRYTIWRSDSRGRPGWSKNQFKDILQGRVGIVTILLLIWLVINRHEFDSFYTRPASPFSRQDIFGFPMTEGARVPRHRRPILDHLAKIVRPIEDCMSRIALAFNTRQRLLDAANK